jgi:hypothetical protein
VGLSPEARTALRTIGNAAIGVGVGMSVLGLAFVVSQFASGQGSALRVASPSTPLGVSVSAAALAGATPPPPTATPFVQSATPTATNNASATPTVTPTPAPSATPDPMTATAYSSSGKRYAALRAPVGYLYLAPVAGTIQVRLYQLIDGQVRIGSSVPSLPFFPYVTLESTDRRIIYRPGALGVDTDVLVKDGQRAEPGTPLFKTIGEGASSWRTFYDRGMTANVIASVAALPSGAEVDPVAFFAPR